MTYKLTFTVFEANPKQLHLASSSDVVQTKFDGEAARSISDRYAHIMEAEHGFRPKNQSTKKALKELADDFRNNILTGAVGIHFNDECRNHLSDPLTIQIQGIPELINLPWEILHHNHHPLLTFHENTRLVRLSSDQPTSSPNPDRPPGPLRVLFVAAEPNDLSPIFWRDALWQLRTQLWPWEQVGLLEIVSLGEAEAKNTLPRLRNQMQSNGNSFDCIYILAHGRNEPAPAVALVGAGGKAEWTQIDDLIPNLAAGTAPPFCLLLGCCHLGRSKWKEQDESIQYLAGAPASEETMNWIFESVADQAVQRGIEWVLSMQTAVSATGAARAACQLIESLLKGLPTQTVIANCRAALENEWSIPVCWAGSQTDLGRIYFSANLDEAELSQSIRKKVVDGINTKPTAQLVSAQYLCLSDRARDQIRRQQDLNEVAFLNLIKPDLQQVVARNYPAGAAHLLLELEKVCPLRKEENDRLPIVRQVKATIRQPVEELKKKGRQQTHKKNWEEAHRCYLQILEQYDAVSRSQMDYPISRFWRDIVEDAEKQIWYVKARYNWEQAERLHQQGNPQSAISLQSMAVNWLNSLVSDSRFTDHKHLSAEYRQILQDEEFFESLRESLVDCNWQAAEQSLKSDSTTSSESHPESNGSDAKLKIALEGTAFLRMLVFTAREIEHEWDAFRTNTQEGDLGSCLTALEVIERTVSQVGDYHLNDPAKIWKTLHPRALGNAPPPGSRGNTLCEQIRNWWKHQQTKARSLKRACTALQRMESPLTVPFVSAEPLDDLRKTEFQACTSPGGNPLRLAAARRCLAEDDEALRDQNLRETLGDQASVFFSLQSDWTTARKCLNELLVSHPFEETLHHLAVVALESAWNQSGNSTADAVWQEAVGLWMSLLACRSHWDNWLTKAGQPDLSETSLRERLRSRVAQQITDLDIPADVVGVAENKLLTRKEEDYAELTRLVLQVGECVIQSAWQFSPTDTPALEKCLKKLGQFWRLAIQFADDANELKSTGFALLNAAKRTSERPASKQQPSEEAAVAQTDNRPVLWEECDVQNFHVEVCRLAVKVLENTTKNKEAKELLAEALLSRGLEILRYAISTNQTKVAYADFQEAYNLTPHVLTASAVCVALLVCADFEEDPHEQQRLRNRVEKLLTERQGEGQSEEIWHTVNNWLKKSLGKSDGRYQKFLQEFQKLRGCAPPPDGDLPPLERAKLALDRGYHEDALQFLLSVLPAESSDVLLWMRQACQGLVNDTLSDSHIYFSATSIKKSIALIDEALQHYPADEELLGQRKILEGLSPPKPVPDTEMDFDSPPTAL